MMECLSGGRRLLVRRLIIDDEPPLRLRVVTLAADLATVTSISPFEKETAATTYVDTLRLHRDGSCLSIKAE